MNTKNFLVGGIIGGVVYFLLGWLVYGNLLHQYAMDHPGAVSNIDRAMDQFQWWALALGNLMFGCLLAYVFARSGVTSLASGLVVGGILGLFECASIDLVMYGTSTVISKHWMVADIAAFTVMSAVAGAIIGAVNGMMNKSTSTNTAA